MNKLARRFLFSAIVTAAGLAWAPARAVTFTVTDLGTLGGDPTVARALNNVGQVVGGTAAGASWIWSANTGMAQIGPPSVGSASGINDAGQVVGTAQFGGRDGAYRWTRPMAPRR